MFFIKEFSKIIYFDKETISNILQESNQGIKESEINTTSSIKNSGEMIVESSVKLSVPFTKRLSFLFSGKLSASYIRQSDKTTTISSTEISEFDKLKEHLKSFKNIQIKDIENSSTFFRVAGGYLNMVKGGIDDVDVKEFNSVMNSYDGYDTYKISDTIYIRFNNSAFVSNYKRNDLLTTNMEVFCIPVGKFETKEFDFLKQINKMQTLITGIETTEMLSDIYPPKENEENKAEENKDDSKYVKEIELYDVLYASINVGNEDE